MVTAAHIEALISHEFLQENNKTKMATHRVGLQLFLAYITAVIYIFNISSLCIASPCYLQAAAEDFARTEKYSSTFNISKGRQYQVHYQSLSTARRYCSALAKAAEFAVDRHSTKTQRPYRLKQIVNLKELHNNMAFWFHVVVLEDGRSLIEASFEVEIPDRSLDKEEF